MSHEFVLLTIDDYNNYLKLKENHEKRNAYHNKYNKNKLQELKQTNQEQYKNKIKLQNEANKKYKQNVMNKIKQDPELYKQYNIKMTNYRQATAQVKRNLLKSLENEYNDINNNYEVAT
jgi:hypothetical protein